jgi:hypothetical protein
VPTSSRARLAARRASVNAPGSDGARPAPMRKESMWCTGPTSSWNDLAFPAGARGSANLSVLSVLANKLADVATST